MSGIIFCHLLHTLWCECDTKSAAVDRKKECQINLISNLFTFCQLKSQIHMVEYWMFSIVVPTCIIFKFLLNLLSTCIHVHVQLEGKRNLLYSV